MRGSLLRPGLLCPHPFESRGRGTVELNISREPGDPSQFGRVQEVSEKPKAIGNRSRKHLFKITVIRSNEDGSCRHKEMYCCEGKLEGELGAGELGKTLIF